MIRFKPTTGGFIDSTSLEELLTYPCFTRPDDFHRYSVSERSVWNVLIEESDGGYSWKVLGLLVPVGTDINLPKFEPIYRSKKDVLSIPIC